MKKRTRTRTRSKLLRTSVLYALNALWAFAALKTAQFVGFFCYMVTTIGGMWSIGPKDHTRAERVIHDGIWEQFRIYGEPATAAWTLGYMAVFFIGISLMSDAFKRWQEHEAARRAHKAKQQKLYRTLGV